MKIALPARTPGGAATEASGDGLSLRQALFREQHTFGLIVTDSDGTITDWSPAAARIFGYSKKDVLGKTPSMFHRPDEQPSLTASILASVERFGYWAGETHIVRKDGSEGITDTVVFSYIDERGRPATIGINRDITESKQIQDALRESAERLQLITDNVSAHIVHYDADRRYRFVNDAVVELLGRPREHIIGKRVAELLDEDTYRKLEPNIEKALGGEEVTFERERMSPDGSAMLFQSNYLPHIDDHGRVLGCYAVSVDITERKRAETLAGENEKRLRLITDNVAATIIYFDADQRYQFVNKGVEEIYGLPHDEIVARGQLAVHCSMFKVKLAIAKSGRMSKPRLAARRSHSSKNARRLTAGGGITRQPTIPTMATMAMWSVFMSYSSTSPTGSGQKMCCWTMNSGYV